MTYSEAVVIVLTASIQCLKDLYIYKGTDLDDMALFFFFESVFCKYRKVLVCVSLVAFPCTCFVSNKYCKLPSLHSISDRNDILR